MALPMHDLSKIVRPGDICLVQSTGPDVIGRAIEFVTEGSFCHAAWFSSPSTLIEAVPPVGVERPIGYPRFAVARLRNVDDATALEIVKTARQMVVGVPYDEGRDVGFLVDAFLQLVGLGHHSNLFDDNHKVMCGESIDLAAREHGVLIRADLVKGDMEPNDILFSTEVEFIFNHNLYRP